MSREEKLLSYLGMYPESRHPLDDKRFFEYAIACIKDGVYLDTQAMVKAGISKEFVEKLEFAFGFMKDTYDYLRKDKE
jgi:hypothetical protein